MIKQCLKNEQAATFPQFWNKLRLGDAEIAELITIDKSPEKELGNLIINQIEKTFEENSNKFGPIKLKAYDRMVMGKRLQINIMQGESKKLIGKDALNELFVYKGQVYNIPRIMTDNLSNEILTKGSKTGITFLKAFANLVAQKIENMSTDYEVVEKIEVKDYSQININIPSEVKKFVASNGNKIELDAYLNLKAEISFS